MTENKAFEAWAEARGLDEKTTVARDAWDAAWNMARSHGKSIISFDAETFDYVHPTTAARFGEMVAEIDRLNAELTAGSEAFHSREAKVSLKPMKLSDGRTDYFVSIRCEEREVTPHVFREEYKAAYHVALYDWLLNGREEPSVLAYASSAVNEPVATGKVQAETSKEFMRHWRPGGLDAD